MGEVRLRASMIETGLKDKVVVVTGGAAGIGRATAQRFAEEGCRVEVWDVNGSDQRVDVMTRTWARELGKYGIRVNAVTPGFIATEMVQAMPEKVLQGMRDHTPLGRMGEPSDVANAYVWLASSAASFIHGAVIPVDGG